MQFQLFILGILAFLTGCSSAPLKLESSAAGQLLAQTCQIGKSVQSIRGTVWLKTRSPDVSGQFPAHVLVTAPDEMKMEITNVLGGTEALVHISQNRYDIHGPGREKDLREEGYETWGGIPLRWATDLFLGRFPCPKAQTPIQLSIGEPNQLIVVTSPQNLSSDSIQRFNFHFRQEAGRLWPESLHWEMLRPRDRSPEVSVEFKFSDPEMGTLSPKKWEAKSSQGAVKVLWKDRQVSRLDSPAH